MVTSPGEAFGYARLHATGAHGHAIYAEAAVRQYRLTDATEGEARDDVDLLVAHSFLDEVRQDQGASSEERLGPGV